MNAPPPSRGLPSGHQDDWGLLARIEGVLADQADDWDDGSYTVTLIDAVGDHRGGDLEKARADFEREGRGGVQRVVVEARGGGGLPRCRVELAGSEQGRVLAEHPDEQTAQDLAGTIERLVVSRGSGPTAGSQPDGGPTPALDRRVGWLVALVAVLGVVAWLTAGAGSGSLLRNPWVVTIVGGLVASLVVWLVRALLRRGG